MPTSMMETADVGRKEFYKIIVGFNNIAGMYEVFRTDLQAQQAVDMASLLTKIEAEIAAVTANGLKVDANGAILTSIATKLDAANALLTSGNVNTAAMGSKQDSTNTLLTAANTKADSMNTKLDTVHADLQLLAGYTDGIETLDINLGTKMDAVKSAIDALTLALMPPNVLTYTATLGLASNVLIKTGAGHIYGFSTTGIVEIRDNATVKWTTVGGTAMPFNPPIPYSTSLRAASVLGAGTSIYYD